MISSDAARVRICPVMTRQSSIDADAPPTVHCCGDRCMAWRWAEPQDGRLQRRGFCGLAGADHDETFTRAGKLGPEIAGIGGSFEFALRFASWALQCRRQPPSIDAIMRRWSVSRATAYRYRTAWAAAGRLIFATVGEPGK